MSTAKDQGDHLEVEVKFFLADPEAFVARVHALGALISQPRVFEKNLRFDTPDGRLRTARQVLRLRQDSRARLTFKGPAQADQPVAVRSEIEFTVSDFEEAHSFLEALDFEVSVIYEKYRTSYTLGEAEISVDEMPYGFFCEIEAPDAKSVQTLAENLDLDWSSRILSSYLQIFDILKARNGLTMKDLTFKNFAGLHFTVDDFMSIQ